MKHVKYFSLLPALALMATTTSFAMDAGDAAVIEQEQPQELRVPSYVKAPIGTQAVVLNADEVRLGYVSDHVIERRSGKLLFIAVGNTKSEEAERLVPYDRFTWDAEKQRLLLPLTPDELRALPEYDRENLNPTERKVADETAPKTDETAMAKAPKNVASSALLGGAVMAAGQPFATVGELVIEPEHGMVTFVLAHSEDAENGPYILPWEAMKYETKLEAEATSYFSIAWSAEKLADAPTLKRGDLTPLKRPATLEEIFSFYKLESPVGKGLEVGTQG